MINTMLKTLLQSCLLVIFISCKNESTSPTFVLNQMKTELQNGDAKKVATFFCAADKRKFNTAYNVAELVLGGRANAIIEFLKKQILQTQQIDIDNVTFKNENVTGNEATVEAHNNGGATIRKIHFVKENDVWKICRNGK